MFLFVVVQYNTVVVYLKFFFGNICNFWGRREEEGESIYCFICEVKKQKRKKKKFASDNSFETSSFHPLVIFSFFQKILRLIEYCPIYSLKDF